MLEREAIAELNIDKSKMHSVALLERFVKEMMEDYSKHSKATTEIRKQLQKVKDSALTSAQKRHCMSIIDRELSAIMTIKSDMGFLEKRIKEESKELKIDIKQDEEIEKKDEEELNKAA